MVVERLEVMAPTYGLLGMTVYVRQETWEGLPAGWPERWEITPEVFRTDGAPQPSGRGYKPDGPMTSAASRTDRASIWR